MRSQSDSMAETPLPRAQSEHLSPLHGGSSLRRLVMRLTCPGESTGLLPSRQWLSAQLDPRVLTLR